MVKGAKRRLKTEDAIADPGKNALGILQIKR
jgi:hypothetical protein